jgi:hypothetical protein
MENVGIFNGNLEYFTIIWYILMGIWQCCGNLVYFSKFWYIVSRKIWQPCSKEWEHFNSFFNRDFGIQLTNGYLSLINYHGLS